MLLEQEQTQEHRTLPQMLVQLFKYSQTEMTRFLGALCMFGWAITLFWPGDTIAGSTALIYLQWASDVFWGVLLMLVAVLLGASSRWLDSWHWAKVHSAALFLSMIWFTWLTFAILITCIVRHLPPSLGIPAYGTFAFGASWAFLRFMARHRLVRRPSE